ncbi:MAG: hypothetical protein LBN34_05410 [Clostridiales Family XIII bacterium]|jgi:hypothetical protein|nr:hypothetical protein [Clostridiales Family XIII bacterium]
MCYEEQNEQWERKPRVGPQNGSGVAGFVLALVAFFFSWVPVFGTLIWLCGLIFSSVGLAQAGEKQKNDLAVAGLVVSIGSLILWVCSLASCVMTLAPAFG